MTLSRHPLWVAACGAALAGLGGYAVGVAHAASTAAPGEQLSTIFEQKLATVPGKRLVAMTVDYAPGGASAAHHHPETAEIFAYVVSGAVKSKVNDGPETVYKAGQFWYEPPGSFHGVSANASTSEPARILAVIVAGDDPVITPTTR